MGCWPNGPYSCMHPNCKDCGDGGPAPKPTPAKPPEAEPTYPCIKCGTLRTKAEGGTTFTHCDACWDEAKPAVEPMTSDDWKDPERVLWFLRTASTGASLMVIRGYLEDRESLAAKDAEIERIKVSNEAFCRLRTADEKTIEEQHEKIAQLTRELDDLKRLNDDDEKVISTLARMREAMIKAHPEWLAASCSDVLECALNLEQFQKELLAEFEKQKEKA